MELTNGSKFPTNGSKMTQKENPSTLTDTGVFNTLELVRNENEERDKPHSRADRPICQVFKRSFEYNQNTGDLRRVACHEKPNFAFLQNQALSTTDNLSRDSLN